MPGRTDRARQKQGEVGVLPNVCHPKRARELRRGLNRPALEGFFFTVFLVGIVSWPSATHTGISHSPLPVVESPPSMVATQAPMSDHESVYELTESAALARNNPPILDGPVAHPKKIKSRHKAKVASRAKIAIVIDDMGESWNDFQTLIRIDPNLSFSVLPHTAYAKRISEEGLMLGYEVLLHVPMEPEDHAEMNVPNYLTTSMTDVQLAQSLAQQVDQMPYIVGVNNHMGSRLTRNHRKMTVIVRELKARNLFFLDSRTTDETVGFHLAHRQGVKTAMRDVFLDHVVSRPAIERQFQTLRVIADRKGQAIAICHPSKVMLEILKREVPRLRREGYEIVPVTSL